MKKPLPFSVFKRANRPCYVVAFKNPQTGKYFPPISTRQVSESAAIQTAFAWFRDGIPQQNGKTVDFKRYSLREMAKDGDLAPEDVDFIIGELQHRGILKKAVLAGTWQDIETFIEYFETLPKNGKPIPKSAKRKNTIIQAGTVPLAWAFNKEMIDRDVTGGITWFSGKAAERQILTPELAAAVFSSLTG
jgi:hypothetical protein